MIQFFSLYRKRIAVINSTLIVILVLGLIAFFFYPFSLSKVYLAQFRAIQSPYPVRSPLLGAVLKSYVTEGVRVHKGDPLFVAVEPSLYTEDALKEKINTVETALTKLQGYKKDKESFLKTSQNNNDQKIQLLKEESRNIDSKTVDMDDTIRNYQNRLVRHGQLHDTSALSLDDVLLQKDAINWYRLIKKEVKSEQVSIANQLLDLQLLQETSPANYEKDLVDVDRQIMALEDRLLELQQQAGITVYAQETGVLENSHLWVNNRLEQGQIVAQIRVLPSSFMLVLAVDESTIPLIKVGDLVEFKLPTSPKKEKTYEGKITYVAQVPSDDMGMKTHRYKVTIVPTNKIPAVFEGQTARVTFLSQRQTLWQHILDFFHEKTDADR